MTMSEFQHDNVDRFSRQDDLVPRTCLEELDITVIGVGAIGRQVALQLACLGVPRLQLIDFDVVEATNITTQGYEQSDLGLPKVAAVTTTIGRIDPQLSVTIVDSRFRPSLRVGSVVFCCVDSISARAAIWKAVQHHSRFWSDGRMLGEVIRVLTVADEQGRDIYPTTLFPQRQAEVGRCTSQGTVYTAAIAAGFMVHQFVRWLRGTAIESDQVLNLLAGELTVRRD